MMAEPEESFPPGRVYTETVVHAAPESLAAEAPYQLAIIELDGGGRRTVRIRAAGECERVRIGDRVEFCEVKNGVLFYRKAS